MPKLSVRHLAIAAVGGLLPVLYLLAPTSALASHSQTGLMEEDSVTGTPTTVLQEERHLGVNEIRLVIHWADLAPSATSTRRPNFNAANPAAYGNVWGPYDAVMRQAKADGVKVLITVTGHAPQWAWGPKPPPDPNHSLGAWKPSASEYGKFVQALGTRYSGRYQGLPAVRTWQIYNEPNFGEDLAPQSVGSLFTGAVMYRGLISAAWTALHRSGHGRDTIIIGALAARGQRVPNIIGDTLPLVFVRELYCLDRNYHLFRGSAAKQRGCPTSASAFRRQNPGLFNASGFAVHPYPLGPDQTLPPNRTNSHDPNTVAFAQIPLFTKGLDRALKADGSGKHYPIWNTEYGYISKPPRTDGVSLDNQAYYLNWAEYLSWKNPRIASFMQYLLIDPDPTHGVVSCGGFASGLIFNPAMTPTPGGCAGGAVGGAAKPALDAWRLPLYLPSTSTRKGRSLEVWGCLRPAAYAFADTHRAQTGLIQFKPSGSAVFQTVSTVALRGGSCYFDRQVKFASSGTVRMVYVYPAGDTRLAPTFALGATYGDPLGGLYPTVVSRSTNITVR
jgi:hypothetical protein